MKNKTMYAFWRYDQFPFVLGGTVTNMLPNGNVETKEYGTGTTGFTPILIVPLEQGKKIAEGLTNLRQEYRRRQDSLTNEMNGKIHGVSTQIYNNLLRSRVLG